MIAKSSTRICIASYISLTTSDGILSVIEGVSSIISRLYAVLRVTKVRSMSLIFKHFVSIVHPGTFLEISKYLSVCVILRSFLFISNIIIPGSRFFFQISEFFPYYCYIVCGFLHFCVLDSSFILWILNMSYKFSLFSLIIAACPNYSAFYLPSFHVFLCIFLESKRFLQVLSSTLLALTYNIYVFFGLLFLLRLVFIGYRFFVVLL